ncbi:MAG: hypothetical protein ACI9GM_000053 [Salibacteraceae bacterium]|jgi:hypothetical protein
MNIKKYTSLLLISCALLLIQSCKCDDPSDPSCPNFDPCLCVNEDFANFKMEERIMMFGRGEYVETVNTVEGNTIYFSILDENVDSVHWKIGTDPKIREGNNIDLFFDSPFGDIEIRCISYKKSVASCLGENAIIDTIYKTLHVHNWWDVPYLGDFEGSSNAEPGIIFNTTIDTMSYWDGFGFANQRTPITYLENFPNNYQMPIPPDGLNIPNRSSTRFLYNGFILAGAADLGSAIAIYHLNSKNINIEYEFLVDNKWEVFNYTGQQIN